MRCSWSNQQGNAMANMTVLLYFDRNWFRKIILVAVPRTIDLPKGDDIQIAWQAIQVTGSSQPLPILRYADAFCSDKTKYHQLPSSSPKQIDAVVLNSQSLGVTVTIPAEYGQGGTVINGDTTIRNRGGTLGWLSVDNVPAFLVGFVAGLVASFLFHWAMH
jgi:hypothetical protein